MAITEVACVGVNPGINIINPGTPEGRILANIWRNVTTINGGPQRVFWGLEVLNPSRIWIFVDWNSVGQKELFTRESPPDVLEDFSKICTHSEFRKHIDVSPSLDVLRAPITEIMLLYFPKDFSRSQKDETTAALRDIISGSFGKCSDIEQLAHGWGEENNFPVRGGSVKAGCVFMLLIGWSGYMKQKTFHTEEVYRNALKDMQGTKGITSLHVVSSNFSVIQRED